ncbi:serine/threonine-protein kinase M1 [Vermiconidia calcicola]|uniref:Serine/threonine-protein kinase M1 n=1 Tax=Vermiconidia calcicola TaxID=1690605 RepID=A0ACC3MUI7_9PEZI|nr:serine/threonine-protein kinase M1 [Vermiconidia calcicola]
MARGVPITNGVPINGDGPPPSTLAAQIVQNQYRAAPQKNGEAATYAQLLREILHDHAATPETDVQVNVKLISVVAEAGLAPLADDNPFVQWDSLIAQATDSIAVIEATIKRQPEVLFSTINENGPQLLLPLLARLAAVCGRPRCQDLPIVQLLNSVFGVLKASIDLWEYAQVLRDAVQNCVDDAVSSLNEAITTAADLSLKLPAAGSIARLWPQFENAIALPHGCQATIKDLSQAFILAIEFCSINDLATAWKNETVLKLSNMFPRLAQRLESSAQYELVLQEFLDLPNNLKVLLYTVEQMPKATASHIIQVRFARSLIDMLRQDSSLVYDHLLGPLLSLVKNDCFDSLHEDLKISVTTVICRLCGPTDLPGKVQALQEALRQDNVMTDSNLMKAFQDLSVPHPEICVGPRRRKRRRVSHDEHGDHAQTATQRTVKLLTGINSSDSTALAQVAPSVYVALEENQRCTAWQGLIDMAAVEPQIVLETVSRLIELPDLHQSKQSRVLSMLAVQACVETTSEVNYLDLRSSAFGQMCLRSLHSSLRELRIVAGTCLVSFIRDSLPKETKTTNRKIALEYLRVLSERDVACEQETLVGVWGRVASSCDDSELELALLRLVDYLGHSNPLICGLAFAELGKLAAAKDRTAEELLKPFWGSIAICVAQDLHTRPQKAQQLCDLLAIDLNRWLNQTQQETIPRLVLMRKKDVLQRIAIARGNGTTVRDLCLQPRTNLAAILALLMAQPGPDAEENAAACLAALSPDLQDVSTLIRQDPALVACYMLKSIGDQIESRKSRAYQAFQTFTGIAERRPGQGKGHAKLSRAVIEFFENHILGIMTHFTEVLENALYLTHEKIRCIKAMNEMIGICKQHVSAALPQIRAALQSAMEQSELCEVSLTAWTSLLSALDADNVARVIDQSFALILRHWPKLSSELQHFIHDKISELVKTHNKIIHEKLMTIPSLKGIPLLSKVGGEIDRLKSEEAVETHCKAFVRRLQDESRIVVLRALEEITPFLEEHQDFVHNAAISEQPAAVLSDLVRVLLEVTSKYCTDSGEAAEVCGRALGIIGCLDPNRVEATRKERRTLVVSNFEKADETVDWVIVLLEDVLVKAFKSVSNPRAQGFLAYIIQELLRFCGFNDSSVLRPRPSQAPSAHQKWANLPEHVRITLTPFVRSKYVVSSDNTVNPPNRVYPSFSPDMGHNAWLRALVYDLMWKAKGDNAQMVFPLLARAVRGHDLAIASFMFPYTLLNVVLGGTVAEVKGMSDELHAVLSSQAETNAQQETLKLCCESVFNALDYMSTWLQEKKKTLGETRSAAYRTGHSPGDFDEIKDMAQIDTVEQFLASIPAEVIATQAVLCGSYARALFNWEQYIRGQGSLIPSSRTPQKSPNHEMLYDKLQDIYAQIDEPDGLEGISAHLAFLTEEQQAMQHAKAGRWTAAQVWYEAQLAESPQDVETEDNLLKCLRETGRYAPLLRYADSFVMGRDSAEDVQLVKERMFAAVAEAHWMIGDMDGLKRRLDSEPLAISTDFNVGIGRILSTFKNASGDERTELITQLRRSVTQSMTLARTSSVQASHDDLKKLHVLYEIEALSSRDLSKPKDVAGILERRLAIIGSYVQDKQYVLGIRRVVMGSIQDTFGELDLGASWLATAKLARQSGNTQQAYNAVLKAHDCGDKAAKLEEARLLWRDGHQRHAIHSLESAIESGIFETPDTETNMRPDQSGVSSNLSNLSAKQDMLSAKANLLLAIWLDASGQSQSKDMTDKYQFAARHFQRWEKGHYYLGKHYQKLLEAEKALPKEKQSGQYLSGDLTRLVIENQLRSVPFGNKYWHQTIPKILTLWLDLGLETIKRAPHEDQSIFERRTTALRIVNKQLQKYFDRVPPYVFYSAVPQMISRITHPNPEVWKQLRNILIRIVSLYPNQALWSLLAVIKSSDRTRVDRGNDIINSLKTKSKTETPNVDLRVMIAQGQKLSDGLLKACEAPVEQRVASVSLSKNLAFNHKLAPSPLVVPIETTLTASLPTGADSFAIRKHKAFVQDKITIQSFSDDVLVLSSLQRPRKLTVRGSDGKTYGLLCKPKDDLRKDQRLMEFNGIINRALKRDAESSKRRLYIKTYAVTPLSEESGIIEWVEGIKPIRDILLGIYARKGVRPNYPDLRKLLDEASAGPQHAHIFLDKVLPTFPASLHEWFTEVYPEPETWFSARLRYARTAAVMSITGHVLGLGDRHGENILLEESTGGVFHVDFNCLFDKGLTFEKPELVPFRLTHNMVDAMGPYGYEGPYRKSCELTMRLLRQSKDTLMTILETFLYDPTTDFVGNKKKRSTIGVPETPPEILESVDGKLKGLLRGETVPLSVEGYVDALIREATSSWNLSSMYIGWCAFL